jgi:hypothetical protein
MHDKKIHGIKHDANDDDDYYYYDYDTIIVLIMILTCGRTQGSLRGSLNILWPSDAHPLSRSHKDKLPTLPRINSGEDFGDECQDNDSKFYSSVCVRVH